MGAPASRLALASFHCPNEPCLWLECGCLAYFGILVSTNILLQLWGSWELFMAVPTATFHGSLVDGCQHLSFLKDAPWDTSFLPFRDLLTPPGLLPLVQPLVLTVTGKGRRAEGWLELSTW